MPNNAYQEASFRLHKDHARVPLRRKLAYAMGGIGDALPINLMNIFLLVFYVDTLKIDARVVGLALFLPRIWDAISDPLMGQISDNTRSRWGRRRPYILLGSPGFAIALLLAFAPPDFVLTAPAGATALQMLSSPAGIYLVTTCVLFYTFYTIVMVPYSALGAELSIDYHERTRIVAWRTVVANGLGIVTAAAMWLAKRPVWPSERFGWGATAAGFGVISVFSMAVVVLGTREELAVQTQQKASWRVAAKAMFTNGPYAVVLFSFLLFILGIFGSLPFINFLNIAYVAPDDAGQAALLVMIGGQVLAAVGGLGVIPFAWLGTHIGKRNSFLLSAILMCVAAVSSWWLVTPQHPYLQLVYHFLLGLSTAGMMMFPLPMIADICDVDELKIGLRREGSYVGVFSFTFKLGLSFTTLTASYCLAWAGYDEQAVQQSAEAVTNLRLMNVIIPAIFVGLGAMIAAFYPLSEKRVRQNREQLEQRHQRRSVAQATGIEEGPSTEEGDL